MPPTVREIALNILIKCEKERAYSNLELKEQLRKHAFSDVDRAFLTNLVNGVLEKGVLIDYYVNQFSKTKVEKQSIYVKTILRLGAYQILFLDKVPDSAACNESVNLAKKMIGQSISGFVNGVLRNIARNKENLALPNKDEDYFYYLSVKHSIPLWIVHHFKKSYGISSLEKILLSTEDYKQNFIRINSLKTDFVSLKQMLNNENILIEQSHFLSSGAIIHLNCDIEKVKAFTDGLFHIQDNSSQLCCSILAPKENDRVLDICSAPGGKAFTTAQLMNNHGQIFAFDLYEHRVKLINDGALRLGINIINASVKDASKPFDFEENSFDKILCDVPCSGLGVFKKKPDIFLKDEKELKTLPQIQRKLLQNASKYLKIGGRLIYSTCTLNPFENEEIIKEFIRENENFEFVQIEQYIPKNIEVIKEKGFFTILPNKDFDGFFISSITKTR